MNADGRGLRRVTHGAGDEYHPTWSADGRQLAYAASDEETLADVFTVGLRGGPARNVTRSPEADDTEPTWSRKGKQIVFGSDAWEPGNVDVYSIRTDGRNLRRLTDDPRFDMLAAVSPTGAMMAFAREGSEGGPLDIWVARLGGGFRNLTRSPDADDMAPDWRPLQRRDDD